MADYIAMLALAEIDKPEVCGDLPSILNLLAADCAQKPGAMTPADAAFLRGLAQLPVCFTPVAPLSAHSTPSVVDLDVDEDETLSAASR